MSTIAATKKAEGNAFFAQKNYQKAIECYTEVCLLFLLLLLLSGCRLSSTIPATIFFTPTVLWHTLLSRSGLRLRLTVWLALSVTRLSWRAITVLLMPWSISYAMFIDVYRRESLSRLRMFWTRVLPTMPTILTFLVFWRSLPPRYLSFVFTIPHFHSSTRWLWFIYRLRSRERLSLASFLPWRSIRPRATSSSRLASSLRLLIAYAHWVETTYLFVVHKGYQCCWSQRWDERGFVCLL